LPETVAKSVPLNTETSGCKISTR